MKFIVRYTKEYETDVEAPTLAAAEKEAYTLAFACKWKLLSIFPEHYIEPPELPPQPRVNPLARFV